MDHPDGFSKLVWRPHLNWSKKSAKKLFDRTDHPIETDIIYYKGCVEGMREIPSDSIDLIIADPPFGIDFNGKEKFYGRDSEVVMEGYVDVDSENYRSFSLEWIGELYRILKDTGSCYIISGWTKIEDVLYAARKAGLQYVNHIVWKYDFGVFATKKYVTSHYCIPFLVKNPKKYFYNRWDHYSEDVWIINREYNVDKEKRNGNKLPTELIKRMIDYSSKPGDLVLDPFMGNGTTAVVSKGTFRHYIGFELNPLMKTIHETNLSSITIGELFETHYSMKKPTSEYLFKEYPSLREYISKREVLQKYPYLERYIEFREEKIDDFF